MPHSRQFAFSMAMLILLVVFICSPAILHAHPDKKSVERMPSLPFSATEQLTYDGEFSKLMLRGLDIVEMRFRTGRAERATPSPASSDADRSAAAPALLFTGEVNSKGWFTKLFGLRFNYRIESTVEPKTFTILRTVKTDEQGKRVRKSEAIFDRRENKVTWTERDPDAPDNPPRVVKGDLNGALHDMISVFYFLRTQTLASNQSYDLVVSDSGKVFHIPAKVVETKKFKTILGKVSTVRVDADLFGPDRLVKGKGQFSIWFTADARHIPVRARINTEYGALEIKLTRYE